MLYEYVLSMSMSLSVCRYTSSLVSPGCAALAREVSQVVGVPGGGAPRGLGGPGEGRIGRGTVGYSKGGGGLDGEEGGGYIRIVGGPGEE